MTQLSDDLRFQNLPPEEVRKQIRKSLDAKNMRYILLDKVTWYNTKTRCKHDIYNMPIVAISPTSDRPYAITEVKKMQYDSETEGWKTTDSYVYNIDYVHQNIHGKRVAGTMSHPGDSSGLLTVPDCDDPDHIRYQLEYESICNPITMHHFYNRDLNELTLLFKGQLMGQNKGSPFRSISSVAGTYIDKEICTTAGLFIKRSAPIIQLLTRANLVDLQNTRKLAEILRSATFPKEGEVAFKTLNNNYYVIDSIAIYEALEKEKKISAYYPVITAEMCKELTENIPRIDIDFGCFGLGSAGTGVLDQLSRSIFFDKYLLVDFDTIETKNLRNQWYQTNQMHLYKTNSSSQIMRSRRTSPLDCTTINADFKTINFEMYDFKYVMSAFDSIETRLDFLNTMLNEKAKARYLIDARYDELTASVFFIDLQNTKEVNYYLKGLGSDKEAFDKMRDKWRVKTFEDFIQYLEEKSCFTHNCGYCKNELIRLFNKYYNTDKYKELPCPRHSGKNCNCKEGLCLDEFKKIYDENMEAINTLYKKEPESSCLRQNFVDIYHYASTYVFDAIRIIEEGKEKPFTHVDVSTEILPTAIIIRR